MARVRMRYLLGSAAVVLLGAGAATAGCGPQTPSTSTSTSTSTSRAGTTPPRVTTTAPPAGSTTVPVRPRRVVLVGDSFADEVRPELVAKAPAAGLDLTVIAAGKAGPCNQTAEVTRQLAARPDVVAIVWSGNTLFSSPCTTALQPAEVVAEHRAALTTIATARPAGTTIALVGLPPNDVPPWTAARNALDPFYRQWAATHPGWRYVETTAAVAPAGTFTLTLPCRPTDTARGGCGRHGAGAGRVVVRDPVHLHFCPVTYDNDRADCPVYSSGGDRYAQAIVDGLRRP